MGSLVAVGVVDEAQHCMDHFLPDSVAGVFLHGVGESVAALVGEEAPLNVPLTLKQDMVVAVVGTAAEAVAVAEIVVGHAAA